MRLTICGMCSTSPCIKNVQVLFKIHKKVHSCIGIFLCCSLQNNNVISSNDETIGFEENANT